MTFIVKVQLFHSLLCPTGHAGLYENKIKIIVFDPVVDIGNARTDPDFFLQNIDTPAFLDEIQYAPELLNSIKRRVDREKKMAFIFSVVLKILLFSKIFLNLLQAELLL